MEDLYHKFGIGRKDLPNYTSRACMVHLDLSSKTMKKVSKKKKACNAADVRTVLLLDRSNRYRI